MNCLRCGRRIDEGKTFCPDCEKLVSQPLPDSPFLDRRIVLPERKATPRQAEKRQREKNERRAARQARAEKRRGGRGAQRACRAQKQHACGRSGSAAG